MFVYQICLDNRRSVIEVALCSDNLLLREPPVSVIINGQITIITDKLSWYDFYHDNVSVVKEKIVNNIGPDNRGSRKSEFIRNMPSTFISRVSDKLTSVHSSSSSMSSSSTSSSSSSVSSWSSFALEKIVFNKCVRFYVRPSDVAEQYFH